MKYEYTWNHLLLLAKVCGRIDDEDSVTASWVKITEEHNKQTFPFTLWPLTYRTCEVTTSPAMCTPVHVRTTDYSATMFKSNEVVIVCIQDSFQDSFQDSSRDSVCHHPCLADFDGDNDDDDDDDDDAVEVDAGPRARTAPSDAVNHSDKHSLSRSEPLLPCTDAHCYNRMKTRVNDAFYDIQDSVECVICIGHGEAAAIASCLASDMSRSYEAEREFLGLETTRVAVDFVGFSDSVVASPTYWKENSASIDKYILVMFDGRAATKKQSAASGTSLVLNPHSLHVTIDVLPEKPPPMYRSISVFSKMSKIIDKTKKDKKVKQSKDSVRHVSDYISALNSRINLPSTPNS